MCTNISSLDVIQHTPLCTQLLPRDWQPQVVLSLCDKTQNRKHVEHVVKCALDVTKLFGKSNHVMTIDRNRTAILCSHESNAHNGVLECVKAALQVSSSKSRLQFDSLLNVCAAAKTVEAGQCLHKLSTDGKLQSDDSKVDIFKSICTLESPLSKLKCLQATVKSLVSSADIAT